MPVCGLFYVRGAPEIRDNFTCAAMHTEGPTRVKSGKPQSEQKFSGPPSIADILDSSECAETDQKNGPLEDAYATPAPMILVANAEIMIPCASSRVFRPQSYRPRLNAARPSAAGAHVTR
jgi:hypothetical protein